MFEDITPEPQSVNEAYNGSGDNEIDHGLLDGGEAEESGEESSHVITVEVHVFWGLFLTSSFALYTDSVFKKEVSGINPSIIQTTVTLMYWRSYL